MAPSYPRILPAALLATTVACGGSVDGPGEVDPNPESIQIDGLPPPIPYVGGANGTEEPEIEPYVPEIDGDPPMPYVGGAGGVGPEEGN